ncbi:MAG: fasciclin domain-containing protein [Candidatus Saccharibacteria bacterium]|nr:fasciclin domain-containing protein [Candidatus Saccharibacteria bacterium]
MAETNKVGAAVMTLVIGALVGGGIGYAAGNSSTDSTKSSETSMMNESSGNSDGVTVGGAKMVANLDIVDNAANAKNVSTVVGLVQQANLVDTLKGTGPFTVFGPNNGAFDAVPKDILDKVASSNDLLTTVLTYHVVPGTYTSADLRAMASKGEMVKTVQGGMLSFKVMDNKVYVVDATGQQVEVETADVVSSNGVTHVIKNVLLPVDPSTL